MNIITSLVTRIEKRLTETKNPCPTYKTEASAEKAAAKMAALMGDYFETNKPGQYVTFLIPSIGRYTCAFGINEILSRPEAKGGYVGITGNFYQY